MDESVVVANRRAMYKTRNTGTGNRIRGTREMRGMLYSGEMSSNNPGNVAKHSGECPQTSNISGNVLKHSGECCQTFRGIPPNILGNVVKLFLGMSSNIPGNVCVTQGNERPRVSPRFHLVVFVFAVNQEN